MWEIGFLGIAILTAFFLLVWRDSLTLAKSQTLEGTLGLGWSAVVPLIFLMHAYANVIGSDALSFLFWYFSGYIVSSVYRVRTDALINHLYVQKRRNNLSKNDNPGG